MMNAGDVLAVLEQLEAAGVPTWLDGGWGVDALLECEHDSPYTRPPTMGMPTRIEARPSTRGA